MARLRTINPQTDLFHHAGAPLADAYRAAAETARRDPHFSPDEGEARARAYEAEAERIERGQA